MRIQRLPASFKIGFLVFVISMLANSLNHMLLEPPLEWLNWVTNILTVISAVVLVYNAVRSIKNKKVE